MYTKDNYKSSPLAPFIVSLLLVGSLALSGCGQGKENAESVYLESWSVETHDGISFLTVTGSNGWRAAIPSRKDSYGTSLAKAEAVMRSHSLFDHLGLYQALQEAGLSGTELRAADVLAWDLHARTLGVPLHAVIGTARREAIRYGDARWKLGDTPETYARTVAEIELPAVKLHFPGSTEAPASSEEKSKLTPTEIAEYLRIVRRENPNKVLAYDPHPQREAAATLDEARVVMESCDKYGYVWIEAPLPDRPERWDEYAILKGEFKTRIQNEESPFTYDDFLIWARSGAVDQLCLGNYVHTDYGLTPMVQMIEWVKRNPAAGITINNHYPSAEHTHLAFTLSDEQFPYFEAPWVGDLDDHYEKVNLYQRIVGPDGKAMAPDWPGIYDIDWINREGAR